MNKAQPTPGSGPTKGEAHLESQSTSPPAVPRRPPPPPLPPAHKPIVPAILTKPRTNLFAILSLAVSLFWLAGIGSIGAIVLGHMAKRQIAASKGTETGLGLAGAGMAIGYIGLAILLVYVVGIVSTRS